MGHVHIHVHSYIAVYLSSNLNLHHLVLSHFISFHNISYHNLSYDRIDVTTQHTNPHYLTISISIVITPLFHKAIHWTARTASETNRINTHYKAKDQPSVKPRRKRNGEKRWEGVMIFIIQRRSIVSIYLIHLSVYEPIDRPIERASEREIKKSSKDSSAQRDLARTETETEPRTGTAKPSTAQDT